MRQSGWPITKIARELGVAKSSVSLWVRHLPATPEMKRRFKAERPVYRHNEENRKKISRAMRIQWKSGSRRNQRRFVPENQENLCCSRCGEEQHKSEFYRKSGGYYSSWCRSCMVDTVRERRQRKKSLLVEYLGGKCIKCGYDRNIAGLEFHHRDASEKEDTLNNMLHMSMDRLYREADKCDLICSLCHRELHHPNLAKR